MMKERFIPETPQEYYERISMQNPLVLPELLKITRSAVARDILDMLVDPSSDLRDRDWSN